MIEDLIKELRFSLAKLPAAMVIMLTIPFGRLSGGVYDKLVCYAERNGIANEQTMDV